ncbi:unnamed protein product [Dracunculus medinensis]|uniref:EF-hand domain-containing protein n=1 Tax=Dracunculus medinensis TaxID=318479 RepID=A0A3P7TG13_DRAME|nr:unnamed protein product [Dracunculus medinensis]
MSGKANVTNESLVRNIGRKIIPLKNYEINDEFQAFTSDHKLTKRELRFLQFASVEFDDIVYMTPRDFLDSLILDKPKERIYRRILKKEEINSMLQKTPKLKKGMKRTLRDLDHNGIISYAEYIFLLSLLIKSAEGFRIAFLIFDRDDNGKLEKDEFLLKDDNLVRMQDTTLILHLFGQSGKDSLTFEQFYDNLQRELMESEFYEFSRGKDEISSVDFARLILRYSTIRNDQYATYINRLYERTPHNDKGIKFEEFEKFFLFLNNLEEFTSAIRLFALAEKPISQAEFLHAVKASTSNDLDSHIVELIYRIFDANNDNQLSFSEFIAIMNDRFHRGFTSTEDSRWQSYKQCIINELSRF